jgi:hypothetical protein
LTFAHANAIIKLGKRFMPFLQVFSFFRARLAVNYRSIGDDGTAAAFRAKHREEDT